MTHGLSRDEILRAILAGAGGTGDDQSFQHLSHADLAGRSVAAIEGCGKGFGGGETFGFRQHLAHCGGMALRARMHQVPPLERVQELLNSPRGGGRVDLDSDEFYTSPDLIGEYPCVD